jgi:hypothetical protein
MGYRDAGARGVESLDGAPNARTAVVMSWPTLATAAFTVGIVWGGFLVVLTIAMKKERAKSGAGTR